MDFKPSYPATFFVLPDGEQVKTDVTNIDQEEVDYFTEHNVALSLEQLMTGEYVLYADYGARTEDGEPDECIVITKGGETCEQALARLRQEVEKSKEE